MTESSKERTYTDDEVRERLQRELPRWYLEDGWIRRKYRTHSWKGTLMVINTVGHLAEAAWHHPDITASYAWVEVRLQNHSAKGITDKDFELAKKIEDKRFLRLIQAMLDAGYLEDWTYHARLQRGTSRLHLCTNPCERVSSRTRPLHERHERTLRERQETQEKPDLQPIHQHYQTPPKRDR